MIFDHAYISSLKEYIDRKIIEKLSAFRVADIPLFLQTGDDKRAGYKVLSAGTRQFLYDSGISNSIVNASTLSGGWQNGKVDFKNSKILLPAATATTSTPSVINGAYKLYNSYVTSKSDEELFLSMEFGKNPEQITQTGAVKSDSFYSPCYFYKLGKTSNEGFSFGGLDRSNFDIKMTVFTNSEADLFAIGGVIRDISNTVCYLLNSTPLNEFNDLKSRPWNFYSVMEQMKAIPQPKIHIEKTDFYPIKSDAIKSKLPNAYIGVANIKSFLTRYPRQS
jgi:hypothetical protein